MEKTEKSIAERNFAFYLEDMIEETMFEDGEPAEFVQSFEAMGLPGHGFVVRLQGGAEFEVKVSQTRVRR